jgi:tripeptide aminopeptidase
LQEVELDENGYLMATIPANTSEKTPVIGFIAHVDTSPDFAGENVQPKIIEKYNGKSIQLKNNVTIDPAEFPEILQYKGQDQLLLLTELLCLVPTTRLVLLKLLPQQRFC